MRRRALRPARWLVVGAMLVVPFGTPARSSEAPPDRTTVAGPSAPEGGQSLLVEFNRLQRRMNETLARQMRLIRRGHAPAAVVTVMLISLAYGVVHAVGPGHGKAVVASIFLGREARLARGIGVGFLVSFLQIASSIAAVGVLAFVLGHSSLAVSGEAVWAEVLSYGLIAAIGLYMTVAALAGHRGDTCATVGSAGHGPPRAARATRSLILAAGLTPCPSGIIVLLFALANGVFAVGIGASLVMALGMGVTVSTIGVATIVARRGLLRPLQARPRAVSWVARGLAVTGSLTLTVLGGLLCAGAWARLP